MSTNASSQSGGKEVLLHAIGLSKRYVRGGRFSRHRSQREVLCDIDLTIRPGSTVALIGRSGSGKSTLARCLACLEEPDSGEIWFAAKNLAELSRRELAPFRRQIQLIFQEPGLSLNPRFTAVEIVSEPLLISGLGTKKERRERALDLMELVGLPSHLGSSSPFALSGGQRRRLAIARALTLEPKLLILDEALTGLDLSTRAQISNLLLSLQDVFSIAYLCISHDLGLITHLADDVAVMHEGRIVECGHQEVVAYFRSFQTHEANGCGTELCSPSVDTQ